MLRCTYNNTDDVSEYRMEESIVFVLRCTYNNTDDVSEYRMEESK